MTHALVYSGVQARSLQRIDFLTTFSDTSPDGPPGDYTVTYRCQYTYNTVDTNPVGNIIQVPVSAPGPVLEHMLKPAALEVQCVLCGTCIQACNL